MDFDQMVDRRCTESLKWHHFNEDVLPMWVADTDFVCPPAVIEALHQRVDHGIFGYGLAPEGLDDVVVERMKKLYDWQISPDQLRYIPGIVTGFNAVIRAFCQPGDAVIYQIPAYPPFISAPISAAMRSIENLLVKNGNGRFETDFDLFEKQIVENNVRMFILCNPQNPTGRVFSREELMRLGDVCLKNNVLICSDEIHCDILYDGRKHIPIASIAPEISEITITFTAPSKTYNIAGLHASVGIFQNPELKKRFEEFSSGLIGCPSVLSLVAAKAAYQDGDEWLRQSNAYLQDNRDYLDKMIDERLPGIGWTKPEGTFLAWLDCSDLKIKGSCQQFFAENAKVGFNDGMEFGYPGECHVRMNFGTNRANLELAVERMAQAISKFN